MRWRHYSARELTRRGQTVRIIATEFVQAFRKSGNNDTNADGNAATSPGYVPRDIPGHSE